MFTDYDDRYELISSKYKVCLVTAFFYCNIPICAIYREGISNQYIQGMFG
jgi:hypothetical protein